MRSSLLRRASHGASQEPQTSIRPAEQVYLVAREIEASQKQFGDGFHWIERKSDAQGLIGEQPRDDHSNAGS
jgi:hypothetical protein